MAGDRRSPIGFVGSLMIHAAIIAATFITFSHKFNVIQESQPVVPVDLVTIAEKTNVTAAVKVRPKPAPKPEDQEVQPPQPEKSETPPQQEEQAETPPPPPEAAVEPIKAPPPPPPVPQTKPQTEKPAKKEKFDINNIMALLDKRSPAASSTASARAADRIIKGIGAETAMTADLETAMLSQIRECWNPPVGAPHPDELVVEFELFLNRDGSVAQPPQLSSASQSAAARDSYTRAAAEAARRAIYTCAPYKLPADRYDAWHDISLTFDPRQMMGQ